MIRIRHFISTAAVAALTLAAPIASAQEHAPSGMAHDMDSESLRVLREKVPSYKTMTDAQINENMGQMPPDWMWYGSAEGVRDKIGVLVVAHGSGTRGDKVLQDGVAPMAGTHPVAIGFGMAMMGSGHLQQGVDKLTAAGAETIVVVPAVVTEFSSIYRQWQYIFGQRSDSAYLDVPRIRTKAKVILAPAMNEHPMLSKIMLDHATEISADPAKEVVILLGHGPTFDDENIVELSHIAVHAKRIKAEGKFADAKGVTLQDDAPDVIRAANVAKLRAWVQHANDIGQTPLVVGYLISTRGIQDKIAEDLKGLTYKFQAKGISAHPNFTGWIRATVDEQGARL